MAVNAWNVRKCLEKARMAGHGCERIDIAGMAVKGYKWLEMTRNGWKKLEIPGKSWKQLDIGGYGQNCWNGWKLSEMA